MKQNYFILVVAHSLHGRLRRIHVPYQVVYSVLALAVLGFFSVFGFLTSYARMAVKVARFNDLRQETESLRNRYQRLQRDLNQTNENLATLQLFASEVSLAYGIKQHLEGPQSIAREGRLIPTLSESLAEYNYLKSTNFTRRDPAFVRLGQLNVKPSLWPVDGRLMGSFGQRIDPFSGEGALHTGVDISAPTGTPVRAAADGIISFVDRFGGYGRLVIVNHGHGVETYYAHLSQFSAINGQDVRQGQIIGYVGTSGRVTAPHLHYEVRIGRAPVNPHRFLTRQASMARELRRDLPF